MYLRVVYIPGGVYTSGWCISQVVYIPQGVVYFRVLNLRVWYTSGCYSRFTGGQFPRLFAVIPVSLLGSSLASLLYSRFTVGQFPRLPSPFPVSLLGSSLASLLFSRFTVGLDLSLLPPIPVSLLG